MMNKFIFFIKKKLNRHILDFEIDLTELISKAKEGAIVIDVRNKREYNEWHLEKSINIPEYEINKKFESFMENKETCIILYCTTGERSYKALKKLKKLGYTQVYSLYGGIESYY